MLSQLRDIVEQVSKIEDVYQALELLVAETCSAMRTECCTVYLANEEMHQLELMATKGLQFSGDSIRIDFKEGLVGLVKRTAEPLNLAEASKHPDFKYFKELGEEVYQSFLGTPIIHRKQVLGVLVVQQRSPRQFSEIEESFIVTLSAQLAVLIAHSQSQGQWSLSQQKKTTFQGVPASSGIAIGSFWLDDSQPRLESVLPASSLDIEKEQEWLSVAIENALVDFRRARKKLDEDLQKETLAIFDLFTHLLNDPMLRQDLKKQLMTGDRADWALKQVIERYVVRFSQMSDPYLKERARDMRELGQRLLYFLYHSEQEEIQVNEPIILVVRELTASLLMSIPKEKLLAVISVEGAANSHAAILLRALGIPAVMGIKLNTHDLVDKTGIVDGYSGVVHVAPDSEVLHEYQRLLQEETELYDLANKSLSELSVTQDGHQIDILLNVGLTTENTMSVNQVVDGVGLYRTEISFLLQNRFPSEEEQVQWYRQILSAYPNKKVVMRTLDVGGDKPLPYLPIEEDNPFLGWRGIRFTLDHPDIFLIQLRAMIKASKGLNNLGILFPMIASAQELDDALSLVDQAFEEISEIYPELEMPDVGIMLEVPSMLYLLPSIADRIQFISVGTNDLTQYLLAVDRNNARVSDVYDSMHPSVFMALQHIHETCQHHQIDVSICGELAGDPIGALLLIGMGYRSLSMNASNVPKIKHLIRESSLCDLETLTNQALTCAYGRDISLMMQQHFEEKGFAGFIRAGKH